MRHRDLRAPNERKKTDERENEGIDEKKQPKKCRQTRKRKPIDGVLLYVNNGDIPRNLWRRRSGDHMHKRDGHTDANIHPPTPFHPPHGIVVGSTGWACPASQRVGTFPRKLVAFCSAWFSVYTRFCRLRWVRGGEERGGEAASDGVISVAAVTIAPQQAARP